MHVLFGNTLDVDLIISTSVGQKFMLLFRSFLYIHAAPGAELCMFVDVVDDSDAKGFERNKDSSTREQGKAEV